VREGKDREREGEGRIGREGAGRKGKEREGERRWKAEWRGKEGTIPL
jgi:hypothetical protein